jgi:hypothetical protein
MKAIYSSIVAPYMVAKHNGEHSPMTSGDKGTHVHRKDEIEQLEEKKVP